MTPALMGGKKLRISSISFHVQDKPHCPLHLGSQNHVVCTQGDRAPPSCPCGTRTCSAVPACV